MRGKGGRTGSSGRYTGITPACAGKSWLRKRAPSTVWDHPRVCGEKFALPVNAILKPGSPPRVRGKGQGFQVCKVARGITPAYAGKSQYRSVLHNPTQDHPRVCGEKSFSWMWAIASRGSPPRVRGKDRDPHESLPTGRITPAYAGKRIGVVLFNHNREDHPRVCGEKNPGELW